jgi:transcriptional antiterminator RfaH
MTSGLEAPTWIAVRTHTNAENKAAYHLRNQDYSVYLPKCLRLIRHARRRETRARPLFPRYLFVRLESGQAWRSVESTIGVSGLVCFGGRPALMPQSVIEEIRCREDESGFVRLNHGRQFVSGEHIRIEHGSFSGLSAVFERIDDEERVVVLLNILGRSVKARVPRETISAFS